MPVMNYRKGTGAETSWIIEETSFHEKYTGKCESIFTQGNGYLGLRNSLEERYVDTVRGMFITGTFNKASKEEATELPNISDIVNMEIELNGERFSMTEDNLKEYSRTLNLYTGETCRNVLWEGKNGDVVQLSFHRFVSYKNVHVIGAYVEIKPVNCDVKATVVSGINAQVTNNGAQHLTEVSKRAFDEKYLQMGMVTTESEVAIAVSTVHDVFLDGEKTEETAYKIVDDRRKIHAKIQLDIPKGETARVEKISTVHSSRDLEYTGSGKEPDKETVYANGLENLKEAECKGYRTLLQESREVWEAIWKKQDIVIDSREDDAQVAVRFALYHLQIMVRKEDNRVGIGAKALSGEGYKGHSFWDTETFIFPYFQMAEPEVARTLLEFRYKGLYGARKKAKENGYKGAMYPWEAAWISDGEVTPYVIGVNVHTGETLICLTGVIEQHITSDIIFALWQYYTATGDQDFMDRYGYEMIIETARFWNSRLEWIEENGRYEIRDVIGPDEYKEHVDNNAYTNYMAHANMRLAVQVIGLICGEKKDLYGKMQKLMQEEGTSLEQLERELEDKIEKLYLPQPDEKTGIIPQFDGYFGLKEIDLSAYKKASVVGTIYNDYSFEDVQNMQAGKQADIVELLYQMEDITTPENKAENYAYYEARTLHDSSLSKAIHSITACDLGMDKEAYDMFMSAAFTDLGQEMKSSDAGIHSANMGGVWQDVVMGFGGVRIHDGHLRIRPNCPKQWEKFTYPIYWKGNKLDVTVCKDGVEVINEGTAFMAEIMGQMVTVEKGKNEFLA
ncbi:MAG: glycoside hydrolase family 65 protein [Roseburia inulinivorans]